MKKTCIKFTCSYTTSSLSFFLATSLEIRWADIMGGEILEPPA